MLFNSFGVMLAENQDVLRRRLIELTPTDAPELQSAWRQTLEHAATPPDERPLVGFPEQFLVLVQCRDDAQQVELLGRFKELGLACKALVS